jgi:hypothetical protein
MRNRFLYRSFQIFRRRRWYRRMLDRRRLLGRSLGEPRFIDRAGSRFRVRRRGGSRDFRHVVGHGFRYRGLGWWRAKIHGCRNGRLYFSKGLGFRRFRGYLCHWLGRCNFRESHGRHRLRFRDRRDHFLRRSQVFRCGAGVLGGNRRGTGFLYRYMAGGLFESERIDRRMGNFRFNRRVRSGLGNRLLGLGGNINRLGYHIPGKILLCRRGRCRILGRFSSDVLYSRLHFGGC